MPIVELDDAVIAELQKLNVSYRDRTDEVRRQADFQKAYSKIVEGPLRLKQLQIIKEAYPDQVIPELDAAKPVLTELDAMRKEFGEYKEAQEKEKKERAEREKTSAAQKTVAEGRAWLKSQGWDEDGVTAVEGWMQDNGVANYEAASQVMKARQPKTDTLPVGVYPGTSLDWFKPADDAPDHKLLVEDPTRFKNAEVAKFFQQKAEGRLQLSQ